MAKEVSNYTRVQACDCGSRCSTSFFFGISVYGIGTIQETFAVACELLGSVYS